MAAATHPWFLVGHLIGLFVWVGGLFATYWLLRLHAHAPKDVHEKLTLMERSLAMMMDIGFTLAIASGLYIALASTPNYFVAPGGKWLHVKLTIVVLVMLPIHGMVRARVAKFGRGEIKPIPQWVWSAFLAALVAVVVFVVKKPF